jgi:hypothetical protein
LSHLEFFCERLADFSPATGTFLFNQKEHLQLQSKTGWLVYGLRDVNSKKVLMKISFCLKDGAASSPYLAPFGGWELHGRISERQAELLINKTIEDLQLRGAKRMSIKSCPLDYSPFASHLFLQVAKKLDFKVHHEVSSIVAVDHKNFEQKIAPAKRQKLKNSIGRFSFLQEKPVQLKKIYSFIETCRKERAQTLSMSYSQIKRTVELFPDDYLLFTVKEKDKLAAAAIVVRINEKILYAFYYAHAKSFDKVSPVVFLIQNLYLFAQKNKYTMIDLGTSMVDGRINQPLLHFKKSIGGVSVQKYSVEKEFEKKS